MNHQETVKRHIEKIEVSIQKAIQKGRSDEVQRGLDTYRSLIEEYLGYISELDIAPLEKTPAETIGFERIGAEQIEWLREAYWNILSSCFELELATPDSIRHVLYFPYSVASRAVSHRNERLIENFVPTKGTNAYRYIEKWAGTEVEDFVVDRLGRHPYEFSNFHLGRVLEEAETASEVKYLSRVCYQIIQVFNGLLKLALDEEQLRHFSIFLEFLRNSFSASWWHISGYQEWRAQGGMEQQHSVDALPKSGEYYAEYHRFRNELGKRKELVEFGLVAWLLRLHIRDEGSSIDNLGSWLNKLGDFGGIDRLLELFANSLRLLSSGAFGWSQWGSERGLGISLEARRVEFDEDLARVVIIKALTLAEAGPLDYDRPDDSEMAEALATRCREGGVLRNEFEFLREEGRDNLEVLFEGGISEGAFDRLAGFLRDVVDSYERFETEEILQAEYDPDQGLLLQEAICDGYQSVAGLKEILSQWDRVEVVDVTEEEDERTEWRGYNTLIPKETVIGPGRGWPQHFGEDAGEGIHRGEDFRVWEALEESELVRPVPAEQRLVGAIDNALEQLLSAGYDPVVVLANAWDAYSEMLGSDKFERASLSEENPLSSITGGTYRNQSIYRLRIQKSEAALVWDPGALGVWNQFVPGPDEAEGEYVYNGVVCKYLRFRIRIVDEDYARELLRERPEEFWKEDDAGERVSELEALRNLQKKAQMELYSNVEMRIEDESAGVLLRRTEVEEA